VASKVITRSYYVDSNDRHWYFYNCFCGQNSVNFLSKTAMIKSSNDHRSLHKENVGVEEDGEN